MAKSAKPASKSVRAAPPKKAAKAPAAAKSAAKKAPAAKAAAKAPTPSAQPSAGGGAVAIVSNKVCQAFAKRATGLSAAIKAAKPGAAVTIDEQKPEGRNPDRGSFVVTVGGKEVVACRGMARPFTAMKALDMDAVAKQVIALL